MEELVHKEQFPSLAATLENAALKNIESSHGLFSDALNEWIAPKSVKKKGVKTLELIPLYTECVRKKFSQCPSLAEFIVEHSDSKAMRHYNKLVREFNGELPDIIRTKNYKRANELAEQFFSQLA